MNAWAKAFALHKGVKTVKMVQNGIRQEGISHLLSEGLKHARGLGVLDLQDNTFTILGARALSGTVGGWTELRELGVGDCLLGAKAVTMLAEALAKGRNGKVEVLRLQYNDITPKSLAKLVEAAKNGLGSLKRVELNGNKFEEEDNSVVELRELLNERKEKLAGDVVYEDEWGLDELSDLEGEDSDEDEEEEEEEEEEERREKLIHEEEEAQEQPVVQEDDKEVDKLAEELAKKVEI